MRFGLSRWFYLIPLLWLIPVFSGYFSDDPPNREFLGCIRSDDFHRYLSFISQTAENGRLLYLDYSAVEPQSARIIALYFTFLGFIKYLFHLPSQLVWILGGLAVGVCFIRRIETFVSFLSDNGNFKHVVMILLLLSSGVDPLLDVVGAQIPRVKTYWMDGFSTFNTFHNPLKIFGILLAIELVVLQLRLERCFSTRNLVIGLMLILLLWGVHPNSAIPAYCALLGFAIQPFVSRSWSVGLRRISWMSFYIIPFILIYVYIEWMKADPLVANVIAQYQSPNAHEFFKFYPLRYGVLLPFAIWGICDRVRLRRSLDLMMLGWLAGALYFARYSNLTGLLFQHMVHFPLAYFCAFPVTRLLDRFRNVRHLKLIGILVAGQFLLSNGLILLKVSRQTIDDVWPTSLYASQDELKVMEILLKLPKGNVLVNRDTGNKIGWRSLQHVFMGHWGTTPNLQQKKKDFIKFYDAKEDIEWKKEFIHAYQIRYIWYGPKERQTGVLPEGIPMTTIVEEGSIQLLEILRGDALS